MKKSVENLTQYIRNTIITSPLLGVTVALCCGIITSARLDGELSFNSAPLIIGTVLLGLTIVLDITIRWSKPLFFILFAITGYILAAIALPPKSNITADTKVEVIATLKSDFEQNKRWKRATIEVVAAKDSASKQWIASNFGAHLHIDTSKHQNNIRIGDTIAFNSRFREFSSDYGTFRRTMALKGIEGEFYAYNYHIIGEVDSSKISLRQRITSFRTDCAEQIYKIDTLRPDLTATMSAMTIGDKSKLPRQTISDYRNSGVAHLLAISGLHIGIIVVLLNILFSTFKLWYGVGRVVYSILIIAGLWIYAFFVGMPPSVERAVIMFSLYQLATLLHRSGTSINILCAAAIIILITNPLSLFEVGFQLSFTAMIGISTLYRPLALLYKTENWLVRGIWSALCVTIAAQVTVLPLVVFHFGTLPWAGALFNVLVWVATPIIVLSTLLYLITTLRFIGIIGVWATALQNDVFAAVGSQPWAVIRDINLPLWILILIYLVEFILITFFRERSEHRSRIAVASETQKIRS